MISYGSSKNNQANSFINDQLASCCPGSNKEIACTITEKVLIVVSSTLKIVMQDSIKDFNKESVVLSTARLRSVISLLIVTPLGFTSKYYAGPGAWWFNNYAGGILYEMFWCFVVILLVPYASTFWVTCLVLGITCLLECLQLWHPLFLESIRSTFLGSTLIGTTFAWWDFPHYVIGCFAGWSIIKLKRGKNKYG